MKKTDIISFDTTPCANCNHPKGIHGMSGCWAYGLVEPKCRKHCKKFQLDNLRLLETEYAKVHKKS